MNPMVHARLIFAAFVMPMLACPMHAGAELPPLPQPPSPVTRVQRDNDVKMMSAWWYACGKVPDQQAVIRLKAWSDAHPDDGEALFFVYTGYRLNLVRELVRPSQISAGDLVAMLEKSASLGFMSAQSRYAMTLIGSKSVETGLKAPDVRTGMDLLQACIAKRDPDAHLYMGMLLSNGEGGLNADFDAAEEYLKKAIELGDIRAWAQLATLQSRSDEDKAEETLKLGAEAGDPEAQLLLAKRLQRLGASSEDYAQAFQLLLLSASNQTISPEAHILVADSYFNGTRVQPDHAEAFHWYKAAAALGHLRAELQVATQLLQGDGCKMDIETGMRMLQKLAESKYGPAETFLGVLYLEGLLVARDIGHAKALFEAAANDGDPSANRYLVALRRN